MPDHLKGVHHDLPPPCETCGGHGMVGRPLDDDPGLLCLDCRGTGRAQVVKSRNVDNKDVVIDAHIEPGTCPCGACPINEYGRCATCEDERTAQDEHNDAIIASQP